MSHRYKKGRAVSYFCPSFQRSIGKGKTFSRVLDCSPEMYEYDMILPDLISKYSILDYFSLSAFPSPRMFEITPHRCCIFPVFKKLLYAVMLNVAKVNANSQLSLAVEQYSFRWSSIQALITTTP